MHLRQCVALIFCVLNFQWTFALSEEIGQDLEQNALKVGKAKTLRFLLYDVNPGEGFNLRRDVYMRIANLARNLNKEAPWILVLPPWGNLYHWKSKELDQNRIPWSLFFDLSSLRRFTPVIEFDEFIKLSSERVIEEVYYLQRYAEGFEKFEEKMDFRDCIHNPYHFNQETGIWNGWFFGYGTYISVKNVTCVSLQGFSKTMQQFLLSNTTARTVMVDRAETMLHDSFGDKYYWECRRSMRYSKALIDIGNDFRKEFLDSTDEGDGTVQDKDWKQMQRKPGDAKGGPYVAVHLRRADYVRARSQFVPSIKNAATQLKEVLDKQELNTLFVASDASKHEIENLKKLLPDYKVYTFKPTEDVFKAYKDGGMAIIDQWICSHARFFIGTSKSTFSFRIQEEREIFGFDPETTFNRLCGDEDDECNEPVGRWTILYT